MEAMLKTLEPLLPHRDKIGYISARNTRIIKDALTEYFIFKHDLISKYGEAEKDIDGKETGVVSVSPDTLNYDSFIKEFDCIKNIEHDIELMTIPYEEVVGLLNGVEILSLDWMLTD